VDQTIDRLSAQRRRVCNPHATVELDDLARALDQLLNGRERHRCPSRDIPGSITLALTSTDPRSRHPKLSRALERLATADLESACAALPPPELVKAIHEFNAGEFFEQHETLELLWRATPDEIRHLYEGILQIGVGMHHLLKNRNFHGAAVKLDHGIRLLEAFPAVCHGVDVARLVRDARAARAHLLDLGPERLERFTRALVPRVHLVDEP
jgi:predicted metal-dependent hydrolase